MKVRTAVVLGPGGRVGTGWLAGLAAGMRRAGVDLGAADLIVGTSAGAIVGAILAQGGDLEWLAALPVPAPADPDARVWTEDAAIARMRRLAGARWPDRPLLIPAVDAGTGEAVIFDRHGSASLPEAVAASTAFPATAPPITIDGRRYIDGALRAGTNVDLAAGADVVIVADPMAHMFGRNGRGTGLGADSGGVGAAGGGVVVRLVPDDGAIEAFGADITDPAGWEPAYQAGLRQAAGAAEAVRAKVAVGL
jgi:NTE family protein